MTWLEAYRADVRRYTAYGESGALRQILMQQGLWALLQYRLASSLYRAAMPSILKRPFLLAMVVWQKLIEITTGICLPYTAQIGAGLYIGHFGHIILNSDLVMGRDCNLSQGVTIGVSGRGDRRGVPFIGNRVYFGANATVAGKIRVGDDAVIGANSLVTADVPDGCTVVGVPAEIVSRKGSQDYIHPTVQCQKQ